MTDMTITEAYDEFMHIAGLYAKWIERTQHLNIAVAIMRDDMSPVHPGYLTYTGTPDRLNYMMDNTKELIQCKSKMTIPSP